MWRYNCECTLKFNSLLALGLHVCLSHKNESKYLCTFCDFIHGSESLLASHTCNPVDFSIEWNDTNPSLNILIVRDLHRRVYVDSNVSQVCFECNFHFSTQEELYDHDCFKKVNTDNPKQHKVLNTEELNKEFTKQVKKMPHEKNNNFICPHCEEDFKTSESLYSHDCGGYAVNNHTLKLVGEGLPNGSVELKGSIENQDLCIDYAEDYIPKDSLGDSINPSHYKSSKAKCSECKTLIECIDVTRHHNFNLGNVIKYLWRADHKANRLEQLKKARWYLQDEIAQMESNSNES